MAEVIEACGGFCGSIFTPRHRPSQGGIMIAINLPQSMIELWAARFVEDDPFTREALARGIFREGQAINGDELLPTPQLLKSRFYRDLWQPVGIGRMGGGVVFDSTDAHKLPTVLVVFRRLSDPPFGAIEMELIRRLVAHMSRALGVMFHLRDQSLREASSRAAMDRLACGVVLLDSEANVVHMNLSARAQLDSGKIWRLDASPTQRLQLRLSRRLKAHEPAFKRAIAAALRPLADKDQTHFSDALLLPDADEKPSCVLHAAPLRLSAGQSANLADMSSVPSAILLLYDLSAAVRVSASLLMQLFDLSQAEAGVALEALQGGGVQAMALRLNVSVNTVKTQLQAVYQKTQTHRQADLLKLLLALSNR